MPFQYESHEFSDELRKRLNANTEYREKAKGMTWKVMTIVTELPFATYSNYVEGELIERKHVPPAGIETLRKQADFVVEIPTYELSIEIATGKKSLESLFMSRAIKVEGSIFKAMKYRDAAGMAGNVTAEMAREATVPSKDGFAQMLRQRGLL
jgi:hypothetical protein